MSTKWLTTLKPSFQTDWLALPSKESRQVLEKISMLTENPYPDGNVKKQLVHIDPKLHRILSGDYRIFYTFDKQYVSLLALRRRKEDTYDENYRSEFLGGLDASLDADFEAISTTSLPAIRAATAAPQKPLPEPISQELLVNLHIPAEFHTQYMAMKTEDDLLGCTTLPVRYTQQIIEYMFPRPYQQVIQQPDYVVQEIDDLLRFKEGDLLSFLLKLSTEQEKVANWSPNATQPTQVKGNPGTGKSTVALYRIRSIIQLLRKTGVPSPRILFVTYTNALIKASEQLLRQLLANDISCVTTITADKLVWDILTRANRRANIADDPMLAWILNNKICPQLQAENSLADLKLIERLGQDYIIEEITQLLMLRPISTFAEYASFERTGRKRRMDQNERKTVWNVYQLLLHHLERMHKKTWQQVRIEAAAILAADPLIPPYDAVIVDEAQDLDPSELRLLVGLCKAPNRFFITADANQSIYRNGFTWTEIHESLKFRGKSTTWLKTNYRSTHQISDAAQSYLSDGALETEVIKSDHLYSGPMPLLRTVSSEEQEILLLRTFLPDAARESRLLLSSCAIFCPTKNTGLAIAQQLNRVGLNSRFMTRREVDLEYPGIKVMTIHSSKGLEFPIVALAGLANSRYDIMPHQNPDTEQDEALARDRRTLFVGMTRAMRILLVIVPARTQSPLLTCFDLNYWAINTTSD